MSLATRPTTGALGAGTNGVPKVRISAPVENVGNGGAYRVSNRNLIEHEMVILARCKKRNLTGAHRDELASAVAQLRAEYENRSG